MAFTPDHRIEGPAALVYVHAGKTRNSRTIAALSMPLSEAHRYQEDRKAAGVFVTVIPMD